MFHFFASTIYLTCMQNFALHLRMEASTRSGRNRTRLEPGGVGLCIAGLGLADLSASVPFLHAHVVRPWRADVFAAIELRFGTVGEERSLENATDLLAPIHLDLYHSKYNLSDWPRTQLRLQQWCTAPSCLMHPPVAVDHLIAGKPSVHCDQKLTPGRRRSFLLLAIKRQSCFARMVDHEEQQRQSRYATVAYLRPDIFVAKRLPLPRLPKASGCVVGVNSCRDPLMSPAQLSRCGTTAKSCNVVSDWMAVMERRCAATYFAANSYLEAQCSEVEAANCHCSWGREESKTQECLLSGWLARSGIQSMRLGLLGGVARDTKTGLIILDHVGETSEDQELDLTNTSHATAEFVLLLRTLGQHATRRPSYNPPCVASPGGVTTAALVEANQANEPMAGAWRFDPRASSLQMWDDRQRVRKRNVCWQRST